MLHLAIVTIDEKRQRRELRVTGDRAALVGFANRLLQTAREGRLTCSFNEHERGMQLHLECAGAAGPDL